MKRYNLQNYIRYKDDVKASQPDDKNLNEYTRNELIIKFLPLVENLAKKFSTSDQASGVLDITDLIQCGNIGLISAVDRLTIDIIMESNDPEKTIKSFLSKRIKGSIRRAIDINRGSIKIPEHKLNEIRNNPDNEQMVSIFFNSIFASIDEEYEDEMEDERYFSQIEDKSKEYNIDLLNKYLLSLMKTHLNQNQYDTLRLSFGLDCEKHSALQIAKVLNITAPTANVIISKIKKEAIDTLIANVEPDQVLDYL